MILNGLGGIENIEHIDCCATRLRVKVFDPHKINQSLLKESGAAGVIKKDSGVQVVYGPKVTLIKSELEEYMESVSKNKNN
jgi:PTS system D-glucosamine-specific IIC component